MKTRSKKAAKTSALRHPLTALLGANANLRVARVIFQHGGELSAPLIGNHTGLAKASVSKALANFESMGVVRAIGTGRIQLYQAHKSHPFYRALKTLFDAERKRFDSIIEEIKSVADARSDIVAVWLYGSVARSEDSETSDLDLAIATRNGKASIVKEYFSAALEPSQDRLFFRPSLIVIDAQEIVRLATFIDPWWNSLSRDSVTIKGDNPLLTASRLLAKTSRKAK